MSEKINSRTERRKSKETNRKQNKKPVESKKYCQKSISNSYSLPDLQC